MNPLAVLGAGSSFAPTGGASGPSNSDLLGGSIIFSSPFAVGSGSSASSSPVTGGTAAGGSISPVMLLAGAAVLVVLVLLVVRA